MKLISRESLKNTLWPGVQYRVQDEQAQVFRDALNIKMLGMSRKKHPDKEY